MHAPGVPPRAFSPDEDHSPEVSQPARSALRAVAAAGECVDRGRQHGIAQEPLPDVPGRPAAGRRAANGSDADRATVRGWKRSCRSNFGGRDNWHRPLVLEQGLKASPWTLTPAEMDLPQFVEDDARRDLRAVPRAAADRRAWWRTWASGRTSGSAGVMFCEGTMQPKLDLIGQALTRDLGRALRARRGDRLPGLFARATRSSAASRRRTGREDGSADLQRDPPKPGLATVCRQPRFDEPMLPSPLERQ